MIRILVDSASEYRSEEAAKRGIDVLPLIILLGGKEYRDGETITPDEFYQIIESGQGFPKTSQLSPVVFSDYFKQAAQAGDEVIYIALDSHLSGTIQSAELGVNLSGAKGIHIVDSTNATASNMILADYAADLRDQGKSASEIVEALNEVKKRVRCVAGLNTLDYLAKGGRLPKAAASVVSAANLKPIICLQGEGVSLLSMGMGTNRAISSVIKHVGKLGVDPDFPFYAIWSHGRKNTDKFVKKIGEQGVRVDKTLQIGCVIGSHIGPEAFGCVFVCKKDDAS